MVDVTTHVMLLSLNITSTVSQATQVGGEHKHTNACFDCLEHYIYFSKNLYGSVRTKQCV